jgi:flagellar hook-length control protein FliK
MNDVAARRELVAVRNGLKESNPDTKERAWHVNASNIAAHLSRGGATQKRQGKPAAPAGFNDAIKDSNLAAANEHGAGSASEETVANSSRSAGADQAGGHHDARSALEPAMRGREPERIRDAFEVLHAYKAQVVRRPISSEMHVTLRTPESGGLEVRAFIRDGRFGAVVTVDRADLREALVTDLPRLENALVRHDVDIGQVTIAGPTTSLNTDSGGARDSQQRHQQFTNLHFAPEKRDEGSPAAVLIEDSIHTSAGLNVHA